MQGRHEVVVDIAAVLQRTFHEPPPGLATHGGGLMWIRYCDQKPKLKERVLVLIDGEIHEGYLEELDLWHHGPTLFQTVFIIPRCNLSSAQHLSWGEDPYWMPIPGAKPVQNQTRKSRADQLTLK